MLVLWAETSSDAEESMGTKISRSALLQAICVARRVRKKGRYHRDESNSWRGGTSRPVVSVVKEKFEQIDRNVNGHGMMSADTFTRDSPPRYLTLLYWEQFPSVTTHLAAALLELDDVLHELTIGPAGR